MGNWKGYQMLIQKDTGMLHHCLVGRFLAVHRLVLARCGHWVVASARLDWASLGAAQSWTAQSAQPASPSGEMNWVQTLKVQISHSSKRTVKEDRAPATTAPHSHSTFSFWRQHKILNVIIVQRIMTYILLEVFLRTGTRKINA